MTYQVTYNAEMHVVETQARGNLTLDEARQLISAIARVCIQNNCFFCLSDYRELTLGLSVVDIYDLPRILSDTLVSLGVSAVQIRRAIVVAKDIKNFEFFETVTLNSGQNAKLLQDMDEARKWLLRRK